MAGVVDHRIVVGDGCAEYDVGLGFEQMILCGKIFHQVAGRQCRRAADTPADVDDPPRQFEPAQRGVGAVESFGGHRVEEHGPYSPSAPEGRPPREHA